MEDSKLILLLRTFEKEDWRWFRKFLLSPYFNNREELIRLFDYLRVQAPEFKSSGLKKEKVFKKVFPKEKFDDKKLSYSISYLLSQGEKFLTQRRIEKSPPNLNNFLLKELVDRQLDKHYAFHYDKFLKSLEAYKTENVDYYLLRYQLSEIADIYFENQKIRRKDIQLQEAYNNLNQFYFLNTLKHGCELLTRQKAYGGEYDLSFTDLVVQYLKNQKEIEPIIILYLQVYLLLKEDNTTNINFEQFKTFLYKFQETLPLTERRLVFLRALNHCALQINQQKERIYFTEQSLEIYLAGIKKDILLVNGVLTPWTFKNVIKNGLNLKKYDFTEEFIQTYHKKLEPAFQDDALHYNLADLYYRKKEYAAAQTNLIQVQFSDIFYTLGAKAMLLKIYYETDEVEALFALVASFSIYLRRNKKISNTFRAAFSNFNNLLSKIIRAKKEKIPALIEEIKATKQLTNRTWLLEICEQKK